MTENESEQEIGDGQESVVADARQPYCCFVWNGLSCGDTPEYAIYDNGDPSPESYTHSCVKHVGHLLGHLDPGTATRDEWLVVPLRKDCRIICGMCGTVLAENYDLDQHLENDCPMARELDPHPSAFTTMMMRTASTTPPDGGSEISTTGENL